MAGDEKDNAWPLPAFHFSVSFAGSGPNIPDAVFQEVSGLESSIEVETVVEGENRFAHQLPKPIRHNNVKLKRGLTKTSSALFKWCKSTFENDFAKMIETKKITISLLSADGDPVGSWTIASAWPVKWSAGNFNAMKNELTIETIELAYTTLRRKV